MRITSFPFIASIEVGPRSSFHSTISDFRFLTTICSFYYYFFGPITVKILDKLNLCNSLDINKVPEAISALNVF